MKLTYLTIDKLRWLYYSPEFRKRKIETLFRAFLWEIHRLRNDELVVRFDGSDLQVDCHDGIGRVLYYFNGAIDQEIFTFLDGYLRRGFTVVDVGANIGIYTTFAAKRVGPNGVVYSFEPNPEVIKRLEANITTDNVRIVRMALCAEPGTIRFHVADDTAKGTIRSARNESATLEVPCLSLDRFHAEAMLGATIDYLKIDVAGGDYDVLSGAKNVFAAQKVRLVQVECLRDKKAIRDFLLDHGYLLYRILPTGTLAHFRNGEPTAFPHDRWAPINLFAHPPDVQILS